MKRVLSIVVATAIFTQTTVSAGILNEAFGGSSHTTKWGKHIVKDENGNLQKADFYSGNFSYSFKTSYPEPVIAATPPSIEAGCNGINIKGMFISLLGIDQFGSMLHSAGVSVAWGIVIGLVYSLPGVSNAFKLINYWAKKLQQIMGNACRSGIAIGKAIADSDALGLNKLSKKVDTALQEDLPNMMQNGADKLVSAMGLSSVFSSFDSSGVLSFGGDHPAMDEADKQDAVSSLMKGIFNYDPSFGGEVMKSVIFNTSGVTNIQNRDRLIKLIFDADPNAAINGGQAYEYKKVALTAGTVAASAVPGDIKQLPITSVVDAAGVAAGDKRLQAEIKLFSYILVYNYVGDIITLNSKSALESALNKVTKPNAGEEEKQKAVKELQSLDSLAGLVDLSGSGASMPADAAGTAIAKFLLYGQSNNGKDTVSMTAPIMNAIRVQEKASAGGNVGLAIVVADPKDTKPIPLDFSEFKGTIASSECVVDAFIANPDADPSDACAAGVPATFDGIGWFITVVRNSPASKKQGLRDALVRYNGVIAAQAMIDSMQETLQEVKGFGSGMIVPNGTEVKKTNDKGAKPKRDSAAMHMKYIQKLSKVIEKAKAVIQKNSKGLITYQKDVKGLFQEQELENNRRGMKAATN